MSERAIGIAIVGCGFVADYYIATLNSYPDLDLIGVFDTDTARLGKFCDFYKQTAYSGLDELLNDRQVSIVLNLTNPRKHFEISRRCLLAGKHVYSEKPLAMNYEDAKALVDIAEDKGLLISSAPCSVLGKASRSLSHAVKEEVCGKVHLVYAELDDGLVHRMAFRKWVSQTGAPWPYRDEFEVGCTLEHAGYYLSWLIEMFGPVKSVTGYSDCLVPDKIGEEPALSPADTPDLSIGILKFESGVVARLSTSIIARHDHSIRIFCEDGIISMKDCWNNNGDVYFQNLVRLRRRTFVSPFKKRVKPAYSGPVNKLKRGNTRMDFMLGVQELADAINKEKQQILSARFSLHVNEVTYALQYAGAQSSTYLTKSRF